MNVKLVGKNHRNFMITVNVDFTSQHQELRRLDYPKT